MVSPPRDASHIFWKETVRRASRREIMSNAAERISDVEHIAPLLRREGIGRMTCVRARVRITILGPAWCASNTRRVRLNISHAAMREVLSLSRLARSLSSRSPLANGESRPDYGYIARNETDDECSKAERRTGHTRGERGFFAILGDRVEGFSMKCLRSTNVKYGNAIRFASSTLILDLIPCRRSFPLPRGSSRAYRTFGWISFPTWGPVDPLETDTTHLMYDTAFFFVSSHEAPATLLTTRQYSPPQSYRCLNY